MALEATETLLLMTNSKSMLKAQQTTWSSIHQDERDVVPMLHTCKKVTLIPIA